MTRASLAATLAAMLTAAAIPPARASDPATACDEGIDLLREALDLDLPESSGPRMRADLSEAERGRDAGAFAACLAAIADARTVLDPGEATR